MPTEPTELDARELLARAAATIDVADDAPLTLTGLPEPTPRRWPLLVAVAAAVVLVVGGGWVIATRLGGTGPGDGPVAPAAVDPRGLEHQRAFPPDRMPSVLGYTEAEALDLLTGRGRGLDVRVRALRDGCNVEDMAVGASVPVGSRLRPGTTVTLTVIKPRAVVDCVGEPDWQSTWALARFARGLAGPPDLAEQVRLSVVEGGEAVGSVTMSGDDLADRWAWTACGTDGCHSVLGGFAAMLSDPATWPYPGTPSLVAEQGGRCLPDGSLGSWSLHVWVEVPTDGVFCPSTSLLIGTDDHGDVDAVELHLPGASEGSDITEPELDDSLERLSAAQRFVGWARGGSPAPAFAEEVRHLNGGLAPAWNEEPERRDGWSGCSGLGFPDCEIDPVAAIARYDGHVVATRGRSTCPDGGSVPEEYASAADDVVRLGEPEPASCGTAWAVELWIDEDGEIYAVNQAGSPTPQ